MFISYKKINGIEYGYVIHSSRDGGTVSQEIIHYLGRVLDKEKLIFRNKENGIFQYDKINDRFLPIPHDFDEPVTRRKNAKGNTGCFGIDFGDVYFIDKFSKMTGFTNVIHSIRYKNLDTILALFYYYVSSDSANRYAQSWWESSYAGVLFPKAKLDSHKISETLAAIGRESVFRDFLTVYCQFISDYYSSSTEMNQKKLPAVLIAGTGIPNLSKMNINAVSHHNGEIVKENSIVYGLHQKTGIPLYYRYLPDFSIDSEIITDIRNELKEHGVDSTVIFFDKKFFHPRNADMLYTKNIAFISEVHPKFEICKKVLKDHLSSLNNSENLCNFHQRFVFVKHFECKIGKYENYPAHLYMCRDMAKECMDKEKIMSEISLSGIPESSEYEAIEKAGIIFLISSEYFRNDELLDIYYSREHIDEIFKISNHDNKIIPLCVEKESVFRGHLFMTFLTAVFHTLLSEEMKNSQLSIPGIFQMLKGHHARISPKMILVDEPRKNAKEVYEQFHMDVPIQIPVYVKKPE